MKSFPGHVAYIGALSKIPWFLHFQSHGSLFSAVSKLAYSSGGGLHEEQD